MEKRGIRIDSEVHAIIIVNARCVLLIYVGWGELDDTRVLGSVF